MAWRAVALLTFQMTAARMVAAPGGGANFGAGDQRPAMALPLRDGGASWVTGG
jgi:hypothetical protein